MPVAFADCQTEHVASLREFFARVYGSDSVLSVDHGLFEWQFHDSAAQTAGRYTLLLALVDDEIAGCLGYLPVDVDTPEGTASGAWLVNWIVDEERRQLGLGPLLVREVTDRF